MIFFAEKHLDVSTPEGIFETMDYVIKAAACPDTAGAKGTIMVWVSETPSKNPPEHSLSESRDNYGMITKQVKVRINRTTPPWPEMTHAPIPNDTLRTLVHPPPPRQPPRYWHIENLY